MGIVGDLWVLVGVYGGNLGNDDFGFKRRIPARLPSKSGPIVEIMSVVRGGGLEPPRLSAYAPQAESLPSMTPIFSGETWG